ncbi:MAG TPA: dual specificity protein phosphatase family protein [Candidatus Methylomirabilis sp.]|nr:dual specificity protein phosphatase family protein [Candidatus Methylomirabilis sp.]
MQLPSGLVNRLKSRTNAKGHVMMDVSRITENVYVGTNACCQVHYTRMLLDKGVAHDLSLEGERVDAPYGVESYLWLPTPDHTAPTRQSLDLGIAYIREVIRSGGKVFIHCTNGHGRAPTMAAAWLISQGRSVDEAVSTVRAGRKEIHIEPAQMEALKMFAS